MRNMIRAAIISICCLCVFFPQAQAAKAAKVSQVTKEKLVLMPLRLGEEDQQLQGAMETALVEGLQRQYEVFSGEQVARKAREIFSKESRNTAHKECDETRCLQGIAESFQSELLATANVTKQDGGYFLVLSIRNLYDNKDVYSKSLPCRGCDSFQVVDKLKELVSVPAASVPAPVPAAEVQPKVNLNDPDAVLWVEAQKGNSVDDYQVYLDSFPKGKFVPFAKARIKKLKDAEQAAAEQQQQQAWELAQQGNSEESFAAYLSQFPNGRFAGLAKVRMERLKNDVAAKEEQRLWISLQTSDDAAAIQAFLDRYPSSSHALMARQRLALIRQAEAEMRPGKVLKDCPECPEVVILPAGSLNMGSDSGAANEKPVHHVSFDRPFAMGKTEVTRAQFSAFVSATGYDAGNTCWIWSDKWENISGKNWRNPGFQQEANHPVTCVNWNDAKAYADWLSRKTGKSYRLPSESEWEYACRAGGQSKYCGADAENSVAWYGKANGDMTHAVAGKQANAWGLYDMSGNVWEWGEDAYHDSYNGAPSNGSAWTGDAAARRVLRGGSWNFILFDLRTTGRMHSEAGNRYIYGGLRVVRELQ